MRPCVRDGAQVVPIIDIPGISDHAAETVCIQLGIKNQHDAKKLEEAKKMVCV